MARYYIYITDNGTPKTGLAPSIIVFRKASDWTSAGTPPSISEAGNGFYFFDFSPTERVIILVDAGSVLADIDRYIPLEISEDDFAITNARLKELDPENMPADIDTIKQNTASMKTKLDRISVPANIGSVYPTRSGFAGKLADELEALARRSVWHPGFTPEVIKAVAKALIEWVEKGEQ